MSKDKILIVAFNDLGIGGIQNVIMNIVRHISSDFTFDIVCFDNDRTDFEEEFKSFGGSIFYVKSGSLKQGLRKKIEFYLGGNKLYREIKKNIKLHGPYAAVHSHKDLLSGPVLKAAAKCKVPIRISHAHTSFLIHYNPLSRILVNHYKKQIKKYATALVACSYPAAKRLYGDNEKIQIIYNAFDDRFLNADMKSNNHSAPHLLQVGMICDNKNQAFTIEVLQNLKKYYNNARLVFIGEPKDETMNDYFKNIKSSIASYNLSDSVEFLPANSDVLKAMQDSDYLLLPSRFEGLPVTLLEAQSQGMHCFVSSNVTKESDCGGCDFFDFSSGAEFWAKKIAEQFKTDNGKREKFDVSRFSPDIIMAQYRKLYKGE